MTGAERSFRKVSFLSPKRFTRLCGLSAAWLLAASPGFAQTARRPSTTVGLLRELNASVEDLTPQGVDRDEAHLILVRLLHELVGGQHLQEPQSSPGMEEFRV